jgi:hypothetical protein
MEWAEFSRKHSNAHLVAGEYDTKEAFSRISHFGIVGRLVVALHPGGEWAIQKVRLSRCLAIYVAYERHADALSLASVVGASPGSHVGLPGNWASVCSYWLSRSLCSQIMAATAALKAQRTPSS